MGNTAQGEINKYSSIQTAAHWSQFENSVDDPNYTAFVEVMMYRKKIAIDYLNSYDDSVKRHLHEIFQECNNKIKMILGII